MTERAIIHVDMDAFYASVEQRDDPKLRGKPVIVGGHPKRGVVLAASYEVRRYGVRSAMPMARALKQAPHAIVVPPRFGAYAAASDAVFGIFEAFTPEIEPLSLDEAFLDVTGSRNLFGPPGDIARAIRARIAKEVRLPASAGIASVKFVAKIASDFAKPNGQKEVPAADTVAFLAPLPVARLWGVGPRAEERLRALNLQTIGDIAARDLAWLEEYVGSGAQHLWELSKGIDPRVVESERTAKSIGAEDTFDADLPIDDTIHAHIHAQAERVAARLRKAGLHGRVAQLKLKLADFTLLTRRVTLEQPTNDGLTLYRAALSLLGRMPNGSLVRLTGVSAQDLVEPQPTLFQQRHLKLNSVRDAIADKFGDDAIKPGDLLDD